MKICVICGQSRRGPLTTSKSNPTETEPPRITHHRTLVYESLPPTADIWITEHPDGQTSWHLQGKYLGGKTDQTT